MQETLVNGRVKRGVGVGDPQADVVVAMVHDEASEHKNSQQHPADYIAGTAIDCGVGIELQKLLQTYGAGILTLSQNKPYLCDVIQK